MVKKSKNNKVSILLDDEEVHTLIKSVVGEEGFHIVEHLFRVDKADEFEIAEKLEEDVNFVRSVMYKMYTNKLVNYTRRRDPEKGWYIYTWELVAKKLYSALIDKKQEKLDKLFKKVEGEENKEQVFHCPTCDIPVPFPKALELSFSCFACGGMLQPLDNKVFIQNLNNEIKELSESIGLLNNKLNEL
jgi:transcription initiation factor TFIIE subunit alpha